MNLILPLLLAAAVFGVCYLVDQYFTRAFRSKAQHHSGLAVRVNKRYGVFAVGLSVLGILAICVGIGSGLALIIGGTVVLVMGLCLAVYYLTHGIFYDGESFLVAAFRKHDRIYRYDSIVQ